MRLAVIWCLALALSLSGPAWAGEEDVVVTGEIVDLACYLAKGKKGPAHKSCAKMCAKGGKPIGVLTEAGDLYLLIDDHANSRPYEEAKKLAGENAQVTGKKFVREGMASIMVTGAESR